MTTAPQPTSRRVGNEMNIIKNVNGLYYVQTLYLMADNTKLALTTNWSEVAKDIVSEVTHPYRVNATNANDAFTAVMVVRSPAKEENLQEIIYQHKNAEKIYHGIVALILKTGGPAYRPY